MSEFKPISLIPGYEEFMYEMNINGVIRREGRELKWKSNNLYLQANVYDVNGKQKTIYKHRIIALLFIPNPDNKPCVDHINGNRHDNRVENLRWCTSAENNRNIGERSNNTSGHKNIGKICKAGVWYWRITVMLNGKAVSKHFRCEQADTDPPAEAIAHRDQMLIEYHGEFASLTK